MFLCAVRRVLVRWWRQFRVRLSHWGDMSDDDGNVEDEGSRTPVSAAHGGLPTSVPNASVYIPPPAATDAPDPFQLDDPDDPISDEEEEPTTPVPPQGTASPPTQVLLHAGLPQDPEPTPFTPAPPAPAALAKPQPALPESDVDHGEEEDTALYIPGLVVPGLFLPTPNVCVLPFTTHTPLNMLSQTDTLNTLLTKYVPDPNQRPPRDTSGEWTTKDFHSLVVSHSFSLFTCRRNVEDST